MQGQVIRCNRQVACLEPLDILYLTRDAVARVPAFQTLAHLWGEEGAVVSTCMHLTRVAAFQTLAHLCLRREDDLDRRRRRARTTKGAHELNEPFWFGAGRRER